MGSLSPTESHIGEREYLYRFKIGRSVTYVTNCSPPPHIISPAQGGDRRQLMEYILTPQMIEFERRLAEADERARLAARNRPKPPPPPPKKSAKELRTENFRTACRWLVPRLTELLAAGWTLRRLFGIGRGPPLFITGGVAWVSVWGKASEVTLEPDGRIRFKIYETKGPVYQTAYPPEYKHPTPD